MKFAKMTFNYANKIYEKATQRSKSSSYFNILIINFITDEVQKKENQNFSNLRLTLPDNFAEKVLNLELDIETDIIKLENVNKLIELYTIAIEYYESIRNNKYISFNNKIKTLLNKPSVIEAINKEYYLKNKDKKNIEFISNHNLKEKHEKEFFNDYLNKIDKNINPQSYLQNHSTSTKNQQKIFNKEIEDQENLIKKRLEERKNKFARSTSQPPKKDSSPGNTTPVFLKKNNDLSPSFKEKRDSIKKNENKRESIKKEESRKESLKKEELKITKMENKVNKILGIQKISKDENSDDKKEIKQNNSNTFKIIKKK